VTADTPLVSVIMPAYGQLAGLEAAVRSVLAQSHGKLELLLVDDGNQPPLRQIGLLADDRVRLVRLEQNKGPAAARNHAIQAARGDYLAFLDADDRWQQDKIKAQLQALHGQHNIVSVCAWAVEEEGALSFALTPAPMEAYNAAFGCWYSPGATALMPRALFDAVGFYDENLPRLEDYDWYLRLGLVGGKVDVLPRQLAVIGRTRGKALLLGRVQRAAKHLKQKYLLDTTGFALSTAQRQQLSAYLALELAAAHWYAGKPLRCVWYMLLSLMHQPRLKVQLGRLHQVLPVDQSLALNEPVKD